MTATDTASRTRRHRTSRPAGRRYEGVPERGTAGAHLVLVYEGVELIGPLTHHPKHSPGGFSWGYAGSGPAELARCLVIDACDDPDPHPGLYQALKNEYVARWPQDGGWRLTADEVRAFADGWRSMEGDPDAR